ncbi:LptF/LptG family permease [Dysgonomonas reticulitermitis]
MLRIKRLYTFIIQTFIPVFMMTFAICLFIVLMQFIWRYVEDFVGKGLDNIVLAELFLYAALNLIPMALPLSLLLASLMAFGSLGERLELLAIKASGVSLLKTMQPLVILVACISIGAFFFQDEAMPRIQVKFRSLMISIKQKSPELDIPEGSFYSGINNFSLYVKKKDPKTKMLKDLMIYDTSEGFDNMSVFVCDSAIMRVTEDKKYLLLNLYSGQRFANFRQADLTSNASHNSQFVPYSRENFVEKEIVISFDSGFDRMDEANLEGTQISKNIAKLSHSIDSLNNKMDSLNIQDRKLLGKHTYLTYRNNDSYQKNKEDQVVRSKGEAPDKVNFDSLMSSFTLEETSQYMSIAASGAENSRFNMMEVIPKINMQKNIRLHQIEWHRKFVLSFACLIFFFIGAPLGAIIRKGGLGMPVVVSVILFIIYYIIDNVGYKLARDGVWVVWQGMWLSSMVLFPLGVFLTYKAMNDSALFNTEAYGNFFRRILGLKKKAIYDNEMIIDESAIPALETLNADPSIISSLESMSVDALKDVAKNHQQYGYGGDTLDVVLSVLKTKGASFFDVRIKSLDYNESMGYYYAFLKNYKIAIIGYFAVLTLWLLQMIIESDILTFTAFIATLGYIGCYIKSFICYFDFYRSIDKTIKKNNSRIMILSFFCIWGLYKYLKKQMTSELENIKW